MATSSIKNKSLKGAAWSIADNFASQLIAFVIGIVLAQLLTPNDYGTVGVLSIFIAISEVFITCGFGQALIRKKDRSQEDMSTAFFFNIGISVVVYFILYIISPYVADYFKLPILDILLKVMALKVVFDSFSIVQNAYLTATLDIKSLAKTSVITQITMGVVGIAFAYYGFEVWALVIQQVGSSFIRTLWLWYLSKWCPSLLFSKSSFSYLFHFGWKLLCANLMGNIFGKIYYFVIGKFLGAGELGLFSKAQLLAGKPGVFLQGVINRVVLPIMVETQGDVPKIRNVYSRILQLFGFTVFPLYFVITLVAHPFIQLIWGEKWMGTVVIFQILCIGYSFGFVSTINFSLLQLLNRTDLTLKLEFFKKPFCLLLVFVGINYGLLGITIAASAYEFVALVVNMFPTKRLLNYGYANQFSDILKYTFTASAVMLILFPLLYVFNYSTWILIITGLLYVPLYLLICKSLKFPAYTEVITIIENKLKKK